MRGNKLTGRLFYIYGEPSDRVYELGKRLSQYLGCEHIDLAFISRWPVHEKISHIKREMISGCVISGDIRGWGNELQKHVEYGFEVISRSNLSDRPFANWLPCFYSSWLLVEDSIDRNMEIMKELLSTVLD